MVNIPEQLQQAANAFLHAGSSEQAAACYLKLSSYYAATGEVDKAMDVVEFFYENLQPRNSPHRIQLCRQAMASGCSKEEAMHFIGDMEQQLLNLHQNSILRYLDQATFYRLLSSLRCRTFSDGECIARSGEKASDLYIVACGGLLPKVQDSNDCWHDMAIIGSGGISGETAFFTGQKIRTADLVAVGTTQICMLCYDVLKALLAQSPVFEAELKKQYAAHMPERQLATTPFFSPLPAEERRAIAEQLELVHCAAGTTLFTFGEQTKLGLYVVVAGWLSVNTMVNGDEQYLYTANPGHLLGEKGFLERSRQYTIRAVSDAQLLYWPEEACQEYMQYHDDFRYMLAERALQ